MFVIIPFNRLAYPPRIDLVRVLKIIGLKGATRQFFSGMQIAEN
jgi:hypothetical protein